jgi:hypothetical protein
MKLSLSSSIVAMVIATSLAAQAQICAPSVSSESGIGDGCSTTPAEYLQPDIGAFRNTFTPACRRHDTCYTSLGGTYGLCDNQFIADMRAACKSQFNRLFFPLEYGLCMDSAQKYHAAVTTWASVVNPLRGFQIGVRERALEMSNKLNAQQCGATPEGTNLFTPEHLSTIRESFGAYAGRIPTMYEVMSVSILAEPTDIRFPLSYSNYVSWKQNLDSFALARRAKLIPSMAYSIMNSNGIQFTVSSPSPSTSYKWSINGSVVNGNTLTLPMPSEPKYDSVYTFKGYLHAASNSDLTVREITPVSHTIRLIGWCAPKPSQQCR